MRHVYYKDLQRFKRRVKRIQRAVGANDDAVIGNETLTALEGVLGVGSIDEEPIRVSQDAIDLIVRYESGGPQYYNRKLKRPSWPGYSSGVTIGFGYDLGYNSKAQIERDWKGKISDSDLSRLQKVSGVKGSKAEWRSESVRDIVIPWAIAQRVFQENTLPRYADATVNAFPGARDLHPHVLGALISIVFNRGTSMKGSRRKELLAIREHIKQGDSSIDYISGKILEMRRLWGDTSSDQDLYDRRTDEARLVRLGRDSSPYTVVTL